MLRRRFVFALSCGIVFAILCFAIIDGRFKKPGVFILQDERLKSQVRNAERV